MDSAVVLRLARLARLELTVSEIERSVHDLTDLLRDIAVLREAAGLVDTAAGVIPAVPEGGAGDPAAPDDLAVPISSIAPEWRDGFFTVPRAIVDAAAADEA